MNFSFSPLESSDYEQFAAWLATPHVATWWREEPTVEHVIKEYASDEKTEVYVISADAKPIGIIQSYKVDDYPEHAISVSFPGAAGIDLFIGESDFIGKGYGPEIIKEFIKQIIKVRYPDVTGVVVDPEVANSASIRAFEKAGFSKGDIVAGEDGPEQLMLLRFESVS